VKRWVLKELSAYSLSPSIQIKLLRDSISSKVRHTYLSAEKLIGRMEGVVEGPRVYNRTDWKVLHVYDQFNWNRFTDSTAQRCCMTDSTERIMRLAFFWKFWDGEDENCRKDQEHFCSPATKRKNPRMIPVQKGWNRQGATCQHFCKQFDGGKGGRGE